MADKSWHQVKGIVAEVLDRAPAERQMFIDEACGDDAALRAQVGELLGLEEKADAWFGAPTASIAGPAATAEGVRQIGRYEIRGVIAAGGMGTVYEAVQDHPHRLVALKLLRRGAASPQAMKRFRHESEILGRLRHPNIAHVHDAGTFDEGEGAQPYFVMELVKGEPLIRYADSRKLGTRQRMELFVKICDAVQYAHHHGVIHRDLKPDNIFVDDLGEPKILDFGVARATDSDIRATTVRTDVGQLIGTVPYMSPEQVTGDPTELDTRSDVYSLGVVLYELMSGRLPHDLRGKTIPEAVRVIREDDPTPLSSVNRVFRGDVETIVAKALAKEKVRRYQTAADLASDVRRYLKDEPIVARPASTFYQLRKFARRNKALVGGATVAAAALVLGTAVASWQAVQATHARNQAVDVNAFLFEVLGATDFVEEGRRLDVMDVLDRAVAAIPLTFADRPLLEAEVRHRLGISYASMSAFDKGIAQLRAAREIRTRELGPEHRDTLETTATLGEILSRIYRWYEAEQLWRKIIAARERTLGANHPDTLRAMSQLSRPLVNLYLVDEAVDLSRRSAQGLIKALGEDHEDAIYAYLWSWSPLYSQGRYDDLQQVLDNAVEMAERALPEDHRVRLLAKKWLGEWLCMRGHWDKGWPILEGALAAQQRLYPGDDLRTLKWTDGVGSQMVRNGPDRETKQEGVRMVRQAAEGMARLFGDDHIHTGYALEHLATAERTMGNPEAAEGNYRRALAIKRAHLGDDHPHASNTLIRLGWTLVELDRLKEGEELLREGLERNLKLIATLPVTPVTKAHRDTIFSLANLASMLERQGRMVDAEGEWRRAVAIWERGGDPGYRQQELRLAHNLAAQRRYDEADEIYRRVVAWRQDTLGKTHAATLEAANSLAWSLKRFGNPDKLAEAEELARETVGHARSTLRDTDERLYTMTNTLAVVLNRRGKNAEAVLEFEQVAAVAPAKLSRVYYGRCLTALGRHEEAETVLLAVDGVGIVPARYALIDLYDAWGKPEKAAEYRALLSAPQEVEAPK
ncbi:MAG: tetratricopeptide repeat protein [Planctomycetota bacterium]|jgi:tetratricopeptide (TPR) repeat protein